MTFSCCQIDLLQQIFEQTEVAVAVNIKRILHALLHSSCGPTGIIQSESARLYVAVDDAPAVLHREVDGISLGGGTCCSEQRRIAPDLGLAWLKASMRPRKCGRARQALSGGYRYSTSSTVLDVLRRTTLDAYAIKSGTVPYLHASAG